MSLDIAPEIDQWVLYWQQEEPPENTALACRAIRRAFEVAVNRGYLQDKEAIVLTLRFGLGETPRALNLVQIAPLLELSVERVRQLEAQGLKKLLKSGLFQPLKEVFDPEETSADTGIRVRESSGRFPHKPRREALLYWNRSTKCAYSGRNYRYSQSERQLGYTWCPLCDRKMGVAQRDVLKSHRVPLVDLTEVSDPTQIPNFSLSDS